MESAAAGILAGINAVRYLEDGESFVLPDITMLGAMVSYITNDTVSDFQPMGASFGLLTPLDEKIRDKKERYTALAIRSLDYLKQRLLTENIPVRHTEILYEENSYENNS